MRKGQNSIMNNNTESRMSKRTIRFFAFPSQRRHTIKAPVRMASCIRKKRNIRNPCRLYNRACSASKRIRAEKLRDKPVLTEDSPVRIAEPEGKGCFLPAAPKKRKKKKMIRIIATKKRFTKR
jgi:hypothetical protein